MIRIIDRYLGRIILQYTMLTMLVLLGLFTFVSFLDELGRLGHGNYNIKEVIAYVILIVPRTIYTLFPMVALLGTIIGLSLLANDSELIAMRASGISMLQITSAALKIGGIFVLVAILVGEFIAPYTETMAQRGRAEALHKNIKQQTNSGLWMRDGQTFVNIGEVLPDLTLLGVKVFKFDDDRKLRSLVVAKSGVFKGDYWLINQAQQTLIDQHGNSEIATLENAKWVSQVTPQILSVFLIKPDQLSFVQLNRYIKHLNKNQQQSDPYKLAFWTKLMQPLSTAVMVMLAIPFAFANIRSGTLGRRLFIGIMLGIGFYVANKSFGYIVLVSGLAPLLGATAPVVAFLLLALIMMRRVEK